MSLNISGIRIIAPLSEDSNRKIDISDKDLARINLLNGNSETITKQNIEQKLKQSGVSEYSIKKIMDSVKSLPDDIDSINLTISSKDIPEQRRENMRGILSSSEQFINKEPSIAEFDDLLEAGNEKEETEKLLFPDGIDSIKPEFLPVRQGIGTSDCYFLAPLISLSNSKEGRESIRKMMDVQDDGSVIVRFPGAKEDPKTGKPFEIKIEKPEISDNRSYSYAIGAEKPCNNDAIWAQVLERAFVEYQFEQHGEFDITKPSETTEGSKLLTGRNSSDIEFDKLSSDEKNKLLDDLKETIDIGEVVTASTTLSPNDNKKIEQEALFKKHAYAIIDFNAERGMVTLVNPLGLPPFEEKGIIKKGGGEFEMPVEEFFKRFRKITVSHD